MESYSRTCPQCGEVFYAVTDRGICPSCKTFSRVSRDGHLVVLIDEEPLGALPNGDEFQNTTLATLFEWLESGGGPITTSMQYAGKPTLDEVHRQLITRFGWLRTLLKQHGIETTYETIETPSYHPDWAATVFTDAHELHSASWYQGSERFDLLCELTVDGGAIHVIPPDASYHLVST